MEENSLGERNISTRITDFLIGIVVVGMFLFHMWSASFGVFPGYQLSSIHWACVGSFIILTKPLKSRWGKVVDVILLIANIYICYHQIIIQKMFVEQAGMYSQFDLVVSYVAIILALIIAYRVVGIILPVIALVFIGYALLGSHVPGMFRTMRFTPSRIAPYLFTSYEGIFGQTLMVSAQFIYLFVAFGSILELVGAGEFFVDLSYAIAGRVKGGPAQAAVYSSMLMGTVNGSGAANVVTTGTFTIPLMKKVGFRPAFAGAVEAVASSGGQIMPPVMGAVAFLMSEITGIPYAQIALAALIPALLYFITLSVSVYFQAYKIDVPILESEKIQNPIEVLKKGWFFLTPIVLLVVMLIYGYSVQRAAFFSILLSLAIGFLVNRKRMTLKNLYEALLKAAKGIAPIAGACLLAGVIMGIINLTGLGLKISSIIEMLANGKMIIALILAMFTSLLLGMGLPTSAAYMILAVLVAPAIIRMGATPMAAHLFILYFGALSTITPPVALSTFAAAGIADANVWETGKNAMKLASTGFVIPFIFVYNNELLCAGSFVEILFAFFTSVIGCVIIAISVIGWCKKNISIISRLLLFPAGILLFVVKPVTINLLGLAVAIVILFLEIRILGQRKIRAER